MACPEAFQREVERYVDHCSLPGIQTPALEACGYCLGEYRTPHRRGRGGAFASRRCGILRGNCDRPLRPQPGRTFRRRRRRRRMAPSPLAARRAAARARASALCRGRVACIRLGRGPPVLHRGVCGDLQDGRSRADAGFGNGIALCRRNGHGELLHDLESAKPRTSVAATGRLHRRG